MKLANPRLKIERANKHIADIEERIARLKESEFSTVEIDADGRKILKHDFGDTTAFTDIALILGDAIHNLKSALDHTWIATIERLVPTAVSKFAKFPVYKTSDKLKGALHGGKIDSVCPALFDLVFCNIKPYDGGNSAVWPVHNLDILDKHKLLIPIITYAAVVGIELEDEAGRSAGGGSTLGTDQQPPYFLPFARSVNFKNNGKIVFEIMLKDASGYYINIPEAISHYSRFILQIVQTFEAFLQVQISRT